MKTITALNSLAIAAITVMFYAACDSKVESARKDALETKADALENKADAVRKDTKSDAAVISKQGELDAAATEAEAKRVAEEKAAALRNAGDQAAKSLEEKAKETREQK